MCPLPNIWGASGNLLANYWPAIPPSNCDSSITPPRCAVDGRLSSLVLCSASPIVPSRAPETVTLQSLDPNSIMVSWSPIPKEYRHGVLLQYNVYYRNQATKVRRSLDAAGVIHTRSVNASVLSLELTGLTAFSSYAVWLSGSTSKGGGPSTTPKIVQTEEDGKFVWYVQDSPTWVDTSRSRQLRLCCVLGY